MPILLFPDNTALINFALLDDGMDLLGKVLAGTGKWCATIAQECDRSSRYAGLEGLATAGVIFGEPLYPDGAEHVDTRVIRDFMARPGDPSDKHLGEAETMAIIGRRGLDAVFVTDDHSARDHAEHRKIQTVTTWDLLRSALRRTLIDLGSTDNGSPSPRKWHLTWENARSRRRRRVTRRSGSSQRGSRPASCHATEPRITTTCHGAIGAPTPS